MITLAARWAALERGHPPIAVTGYPIPRVAPDGAVLQTVVIILTQSSADGTARTVSLADFESEFPDGELIGGLILTDDGREPEHGSLMAQWFSPEAEP
jgi:hypothetical protein